MTRATLIRSTPEEEEDGPRGGPFIPAELEQQTELFGSLNRMMLLHEVVESLPLERPITDSAKLTSGYGRRLDPFSRRPANHLGMDFAGPVGSKVYAPSDGIVVLAHFIMQVMSGTTAGTALHGNLLSLADFLSFFNQHSA